MRVARLRAVASQPHAVAVMAASSPRGPSVAARGHPNEFSKPPGQMALIREAYFDGDL
jgi:hypothetical protein